MKKKYYTPQCDNVLLESLMKKGASFSPGLFGLNPESIAQAQDGYIPGE